MINVSKPSIGITERTLVEEVLQSGWIGQGEKVAAFENLCKDILQSKHFIALSSCTKALEIALLIAGCERGAEVIVPSLTYASVIQVIIKVGLVPVFADVDHNSLNLSIEDIRNKITPKTRIILPLHFRGHACDTDMIKAVADAHGLLVIEDAAHAFGSYYRERPVGADSFMACFSFGPIKNICCIEGGGIATNDDEVAMKILNYRNMGMTRSTWQRYNKNVGSSSPWYYEVIMAGDKCQMNDVGAAVGIAQLQRIDDIKEKKKKLVNNYLLELSSVNGLEIPAADINRDFSYIFPVLVNEGSREEFIHYLWDQGITTAVHYYPNHLQPFFSIYNRYALPNTEDIGKRIVTLPSYTDLTEHDQEYIIDKIKTFAAKR